MKPTLDKRKYGGVFVFILITLCVSFLLTVFSISYIQVAKTYDNKLVEYPWGATPNLTVYINEENISTGDRVNYRKVLEDVLKWWEGGGNHRLSYNINFTTLNVSGKENISVVWVDLIKTEFDSPGDTNCTDIHGQENCINNNLCRDSLAYCKIRLKKMGSSNPRLQEVAKHEIGHALGFNHTSNPFDIMCLQSNTWVCFGQLIVDTLSPSPVLLPYFISEWMLFFFLLIFLYWAFRKWIAHRCVGISRYKSPITAMIVIIFSIFILSQIFKENAQLIVAIGSFLFGIPIKLFLDKYSEPILRIETEPECRNFHIGGEGWGKCEYKGVRVVVKNTGRSSAKNCKGWIVYKNENSDKEESKEQVSWVGGEGTGTINVGDSERLDFCAYLIGGEEKYRKKEDLKQLVKNLPSAQPSVEQNIMGEIEIGRKQAIELTIRMLEESLNIKIKEYRALLLIAPTENGYKFKYPDEARNLENLLQPGYKIKVLVTSENAKSQEAEISFNPSEKTIEIRK
jgi:hypothetical protein